MANAIIQAGTARVNVTWANQNGELRDPVSLDLSDDHILQMVTEAVRGGGIAGMAADPAADLDGFEVRRYAPNEARPYDLVMVRPKTSYGRE